ncbi:hypothetical protein Gohar_022259, partial [Gossypium harknessii]|nr:hypothetical protein [Gossypium harknessii]
MNSKLEEVFGLEDKVEVIAEKEMKFDKLERLSLEELLGLIHFYHKGYHLVLSALRVLTVRDFPSFSIDSQEFVHCKTKNHCWPKLRTLRIVDCQILKYVFTNTLSQGFPSLESVYLKNYPQLKVFSPTEERDVIGDYILLNVPCLENLSVSNCPQFSCFIVQAQLMEVLELSNVGNSRQLLNVDLHLLNEDCIVVGNHGEVFQVQ